MVRNTRSLVQIDLPPRYAQTMTTRPTKVDEAISFGVTESENTTIFRRNSSLRE
ncbi:MAG: hypothetical protein R3C17_16310 [Planctomycetaceae bacterium]